MLGYLILAVESCPHVIESYAFTGWVLISLATPVEAFGHKAKPQRCGNGYCHVGITDAGLLWEILPREIHVIESTMTESAKLSGVHLQRGCSRNAVKTAKLMTRYFI
jgi:hypothetical protein